ncbi:hypothetical protein [Streptomyces varsoviensis]|nr:hypothetical protein [Streptomyces varsoviensis]
MPGSAPRGTHPSPPASLLSKVTLLIGSETFDSDRVDSIIGDLVRDLR